MSTLENCRFLTLWKAFHAQGKLLMNEISAEESNVISWLQTMTSLLFGLDDAKKTLAAEDALYVAVSMIQLHRNNPKIHMIGLKAIQSCVVRNSTGRNNCIRCGVFRILQSLLAEQQSNLAVVDEAYTTLAAVCLGNDLNALLATILFKSSAIMHTSALSVADDAPPKPANLTYLETLFAAIEHEQEQLLTNLPGDDIVLRVVGAELGFVQGVRQLEIQQWRSAERHFCRALGKLNDLQRLTELLLPMAHQIQDARSKARIGLKDWDGALDDINSCFELDSSSSVCVLQLETRRITVWIEQGRLEEAAERLSQLLIHNPQDRSLRKTLNHLAKLKSRTCSLSLKHNTLQAHETDSSIVLSWLNHQPNKEPSVGTLVKSLYGTGSVQEVRKCGLTKIQIESWLLVGGQNPTAYLMPECYTIVSR